ncbi:hypothetical protein N7453_000955 [Penicillium expansum]|nr:hypothetical protein N7453_000955 [Penicillium expansum]
MKSARCLDQSCTTHDGIKLADAQTIPTLWFGKTRAISEKTINLVIAKAKEGMVSVAEAQLLGYIDHV